MVNSYLLNKDNVSIDNAKVVWQIGKPVCDVFANEFDDLNNEGNAFSGVVTKRVSVEEEGINQQLLEVPSKISSSIINGGVEELQIEFNLDKGRYTLYFDVLETIKSDFCIVEFDKAEIAAFGVPYAGNIEVDGRIVPYEGNKSEDDYKAFVDINEKYSIKEGYEKKIANLHPYRFEIPLICTEKGLHVLSFTNKRVRLNSSVYTSVGDGFRPIAYTLVKGINEFKSLVDSDTPGKSLVDLWGWMSMTSFDHPALRVTPKKELVMRSIIESFKWGANNFEFLPVNADGVALDLSQEGDWKGKENYIQTNDTTWTCEEVANVIDVAHKYGMLTEFFLFSLYGANFISQKMKSDEKVNLIEKIVKNYGNMLSDKSMERKIDGIITEAWFPIDGPLYTKAMWRYNPAAFLLVSINDGSQYDIVNAGYSPAVHHYNAHWPSFDAQHTGYDHSFSSLPYPLEFYQKPEGTIYTYMQACGQTSHLRKNFPRLRDTPEYGITNRTVSPDWIIAQAHAYALRRMMNPKDNLAMALGWEADEPTMAPASARRYIYAASQDPIRLAVAGTLSDTGEGGEIELKRNTRKMYKDDCTRIRKRHQYPSTSTFIQNRFIQAILLSDRDSCTIMCDILGSATFYNHGGLASVAMPYCGTRFEDDRFLTKEISVLESAGPKAVILEKSTMGSGFVEFDQQTTHTIYSDIPAIKTNISRVIKPGQEENITTFIETFGYDILNDKFVEKEVTIELNDNILTLSDSTGILPDMVVWFEPSNIKKTKLVYQSDKGILINQNLFMSHSIKVIMFLKVCEYSRIMSSDAINMVMNAEKQANFNNNNIEIENNSNLDVVKCVKIADPDDAPYFVQENNWWLFRGATPSEQYPGSDYIKLYIKKNTKALIARYGYIENVLRAGWGCQNMLAFRDIQKDGIIVCFETEISSVNPMISAPRIEMNNNISSVAIDGCDWLYYDENKIMLPNKHGRYKVKVTYGISDKPHIISSYAIVEKTEFKENELRIQFHSPLWIFKQDILNKYTAVIDLAGKEIAATYNCEVLEKNDDRVLIEFCIGEVKLDLI